MGAHFAAMSTFEPHLIYGPSLISPTSPHSSATYSVWAAAAPHPEGQAVVWDAWHELANYAIYGKIIRCQAIPNTPPL